MPVAGYRARHGLRYLRPRASATGTPAVAGLGLLRTPAQLLIAAGAVTLTTSSICCSTGPPGGSWPATSASRRGHYEVSRTAGGGRSGQTAGPCHRPGAGWPSGSGSDDGLLPGADAAGDVGGVVRPGLFK